MSDTATITPPAEVVRLRTGTPTSRTTIVVAEDDRFQRTHICDLLEAQGYHVLGFSGGNSALQAAQLLKAELIITDLMMEEGEGISMILEARKSDRPARILAVSSNPRYLKYAEKLGADRVLPKPLKAREIIKTVQELLAQ